MRLVKEEYRHLLLGNRFGALLVGLCVTFDRLTLIQKMWYTGAPAADAPPLLTRGFI
jgi:hypothetical protein